MDNKVLIKIKSIITDENGTDTTELTTTGSLIKNSEDNLRTVSYTETDQSGIEGCVSTITYGGDNVTVCRSGQFNSILKIEENNRHSCLYGTPYGSFTVGVSGKKVDIAHKNNITVLNLNYTIDVNSSVVYDNELKITIREC